MPAASVSIHSMRRRMRTRAGSARPSGPLTARSVARGPAGRAEAADDDLGVLDGEPRDAGSVDDGGAVDRGLEIDHLPAHAADRVVVIVGPRVVDDGAALRGHAADEAELLEQ